MLLLELGERHLGYGLVNIASSEIYKAGYFVADLEEPGFFESTFNTLRLSAPFHKVMISYHQSNSLLVPGKFYREDDYLSLMNSVYGYDPGRAIITDTLPEWQIHNVFGLSAELYALVTKRFSNAQNLHVHTVNLRNAVTDDGTSLFVDFKTEDFSLLMVKNRQVQLAQIIPYSTADDVLYHLIKICSHFAVTQNEVMLKLSGLIEKKSAMFDTLHQYFLHLGLVSGEGNVKPASDLEEIPAHYFTSLNKLASCAS